MMKDLIRKILNEHIQEQQTWTKEKVLDLAKKYKYIKDFRKENGYAYSLATKKGWLNDLYQILDRSKKESKSFSDDELIQIALKYPTINQFKVNQNSAYQQAYNRGLLPKLKQLIAPAYQTWNLDSVSKEAKKYSNRKDFQQGNSGAYQWATRHGVLDDITKDYLVLQKKWDENEIMKVAQKYETVKDFIDGDYAAYGAAQRRKILPKVTSHMRPLGNAKKRMIYAYEFPDNHVYVGLSYDLVGRDKLHRRKEKSRVYQHLKLTNQEPIFKQLTDNYVGLEDAKRLEDFFIEKYRNEGWNILNIAKAGGLGGSTQTLSYDEVKKIAQKYGSKNEFLINDRRAYETAKREKWYDDVTSHMVNKMENWTPEKVIEMAKQYDFRVQVKRENPKLYSAIARMNLEDIAYQHMGEPRKNAGFQWDLESLQNEISKYETLSDFREKSSSAYLAIHRKPEYRYLLSQLETKRKRWTDKEIFDEASKYSSIIDFRNNSSAAYDRAKARGLMNDIRIKMGINPR